MRIARITGVEEIVRVAFACPHCNHEVDASVVGFSCTFGDPFYNEQEGTVYRCLECGEQFELGEFKVV